MHFLAFSCDIPLIRSNFKKKTSHEMTFKKHLSYVKKWGIQLMKKREQAKQPKLFTLVMHSLSCQNKHME